MSAVVISTVLKPIAVSSGYRSARGLSIGLGIGGVVFLYLLQPLFEKLIKKLGDKKVDIIFYIIGSLFLIDLIVKVIKMVL